jgi:3-dehydroquinate dehydratase I
MDFDISCCDVIELRLDSLGAGPSVLDFCERHHGQLPLLMTARDASEGGKGSLTLQERVSLLESVFPFSSAFDVEFANYDTFSDIITQAQKDGIALVSSSHDFKSFDHIATIEKITRAQEAGAQISKAAVTLQDAVDLTLFESLAADLSGSNFSLMGMGFYGPASRILAAQHGSILNYGYLGNEPTAPGQWPARLLKEAIAASPQIPSAPNY